MADDTKGKGPPEAPESTTDQPNKATPAVAFFMAGPPSPHPWPDAQSQIVRDLVAHLSESLREMFEERAGILEFEAGHTREHAEAMALLNVYRDFPLELLGVRLYRRADPDGGDTFVLVSGRSFTDEMAAGLTEFREGLVDEVIASLGGVALITAFRK